MHGDFKRDLTQAVEHLSHDRPLEAEPILVALRETHPFNPHVLYNLGLCLWQLRRGSEAIRLWRMTLSADPNMVPAMVNLGQGLYLSGEMRESLRYLQMATRRRPRDTHILASLAKVLINLGEAKDGLEAAETALLIEPDNLRALVERQCALSELGRHKDALKAAMVIMDHPEGGGHVDTLCYLVSYASKASDWAMLDRYLPRLLERIRDPSITVNPMAMTFFSDDPELLGDLIRKMPPTAVLPARPAKHLRDGRITIAYLSPDFREHPVAHMLVGMLPYHDRSRFRVVAVDTLPTDSSPLSQAILSQVDEHLVLTHLDDSAAADLLRHSEIDVLVDLVGSTKWSRPGLLARRPCPAQVLWMGCPCTTGSHHYDAFLVDEIVAPPGYERYCTEPLVRLPCCYHPISTGFGNPNPGMTRAIAKLPEGVPIVGLLQAPNKLRPPLVDVVARCVGRHPEAHLWMRVHHEATASVAKHMLALGLPRERLHFAPLFVNRDDYLHAFRLVDVIVDSYPYGGHSTTGEALVQGAPVLTMTGRCIHARVATSMLREMGLGEYASPDFESLEGQLDHLLSSRAHLLAMQQRFGEAAASYRAHGPARLVRALEAAYEKTLSSAPELTVA